MSHEFYASPNLSQQEWEPILLSTSSWVHKLVLDLRFQLLLLDVSQVICPLGKVALRKVRLEDVKMRQGQSLGEKHRARTSLRPLSQDS